MSLKQSLRGKGRRIQEAELVLQSHRNLICVWQHVGNERLVQIRTSNDTDSCQIQIIYLLTQTYKNESNFWYRMDNSSQFLIPYSDVHNLADKLGSII